MTTRKQIDEKHPSATQTYNNWEIFEKKLLENNFIKFEPQINDVNPLFEYSKKYNNKDILTKIQIKCFSFYDPYIEYSYDIQNSIFEELSQNENSQSKLNKFSYELIIEQINTNIDLIENRYSEKQKENYLLLKSLGYKKKKDFKRGTKNYLKEFGSLSLSFELQEYDDDDDDYKSCEFNIYYYDEPYEQMLTYEHRFRFTEFNKEYIKKVEQMAMKLSELLKLGIK